MTKKLTEKKPKPEFLANCLAVECPELSLDWHPTKNLPLTATNVSYGSNRRVWWKCHTCGHEWQCYISNRRKQYKYPGQPGTRCPNCLGKPPESEEVDHGKQGNLPSPS